jgi:ABC-type methionine transport system ATPase subunit
VALLVDGRIVEHGTVEQVFEQSKNPQTRDFLSRILKY